MKNYLLFALSLSALILLTGCKKENDSDLDNLKIARLMVESRGVDYGRLAGETIELPKSGSRIMLERGVLVNEFQIANVELVQVELGRALLIQLNELGARALNRGTVTNMGQRIVLVVNGNPIGARRIDGEITNGNFFTFVEIDDEELDQLVIDLKESIVKLRELQE